MWQKYSENIQIFKIYTQFSPRSWCFECLKVCFLDSTRIFRVAKKNRDEKYLFSMEKSDFENSRKKFRSKIFPIEKILSEKKWSRKKMIEKKNDRSKFWIENFLDRKKLDRFFFRIEKNLDRFFFDHVFFQSKFRFDNFSTLEITYVFSSLTAAQASRRSAPHRRSPSSAGSRRCYGKRDRTEEYTRDQIRPHAHRAAPRLENTWNLVYRLPIDSVWCTSQL